MSSKTSVPCYFFFRGGGYLVIKFGKVRERKHDLEIKLTFVTSRFNLEKFIEKKKILHDIFSELP